MKAKIKMILLGVFITFTFNTQAQVQKEITLKKGTIIEAILFSPKENRKEDLKSFITTITPIAKEYGANILIKFKVEVNAVGNKAAKMIVLEEWPSLEQKRAFENDARYIELRNDKIDILNYFESGFFQVEETTTTTVHGNKAYDIAGVWLKKDKISLEKFQKYYGTVIPAAMKNHQYRPVIGLKAIPNVFDNTYHSSLFGIGEWPNRKASIEFANSNVYKSVVHLRTESVANLDIFMVTPIFD